METYAQREKEVKDFFLRLRGPNFIVETHKLSDPVGPAGIDDNLQALILTQETAKGGEMVNKLRK